MSIKRLIAVACILLLAPLAAAQPGPAPGYESAVEYAADYASSQAENASQDPAGYAASKGSAQAVQDEVDHTAYVACWALDDEGVEHEACDAYYTPRGEAAPEQPEDPPANVTANETLDAATDYVDNATGTVKDIIEDPGNATGHVERFVKATKDFLGRITDAVASAAAGLLEGIAIGLGAAGMAGGAVLEALSQLGLSAAEAAAAGFDATLAVLGSGAATISQALADGGRGLADGLAGAGTALVDSLAVVGQSLADAAVATGAAVADAARATTEGLARAGGATASGVADAAHAVSGAVADAAHAVKDAVSGLLGGEEATKPSVGPDLPDADETVDGTLDGVTGLLDEATA